MEQYLMDTNIVSAYFSESFSSTEMEFMDKVIDAIPNLSIITQIELLSWHTEAKTEEAIKNFIADRVILNITQDVIRQCVKIRKGKK